jgi:ribosomal protein S4
MSISKKKKKHLLSTKNIETLGKLCNIIKNKEYNQRNKLSQCPQLNIENNQLNIENNAMENKGHQQYVIKKNSVNKFLHLTTFNEENLSLQERLNFYGNESSNFTKNSFYSSLIYYKSPLNLLFSIDRFLFELAKKYPQRKKTSEYKVQLKEQKKLSLFYGSLSRKQLLQIVNEGDFYKGHASKKIVALLERRLDVALYRSHFAKNITTAKQYISHKKVLVNDKCITSPNYRLYPGDVISIAPQNLEKIARNLGNTIKRNTTIGTQLNIENKESDIITNDILEKWRHTKSTSLKKDFQFFIELLLKKIHYRIKLFISQKIFSDLLNQEESKKQNQFFCIFFYRYLESLKQNYPVLAAKQLELISVVENASISQFHHQMQDLHQSKKKDIFHYYRKSLVGIICSYNYGKISREFLIMKLKKYLKKKQKKTQILGSLRLAGVKPLHLETSYKLGKIIFLYSPQRVYYPFFVDIDLIKRLYKK